MALFISQLPPISKRVATYLSWAVSQSLGTLSIVWTDEMGAATFDPSGANISFTIQSNGFITYQGQNWRATSWKQFANEVLQVPV